MRTWLLLPLLFVIFEGGEERELATAISGLESISQEVYGQPGL